MSKPPAFLALGAWVLGGMAHAQAGPDCAGQPASLRAMRECYRPVLVFAPSARDHLFLAQQALLDQYADDMMDRNLLFVPVLAHDAHFSAPLDAPYVTLTRPAMDAIRGRFKVSSGEFVVVLVGKDGGEKFRAGKPISVLKLDALVDAMPMGAKEKSSRRRKVR